MPIEINKYNSRVEPPEIQITGKEVDLTEGLFEAVGDVHKFKEQHEVVNGTDVNTTVVRVFRGAVKVRMVPDNKFEANRYTNRSGSDIVGKTGARSELVTGETGINFNLKSETYYTLNGKNPTKTKANLYTGPFTIRRNASGTDNTIIKARTYARGRESEVRRVEIRITNKLDESTQV